MRLMAAPLRGTRDADRLDARWDGDRVLGLQGADRLTSHFNTTALSGGGGNDRLSAELPSLPEGGEGERSVVMDGGAGEDRKSVV